MGRRARFLLVLFGALILFGTANSVWNSWRHPPLEIGPPTSKPAANFVPLRPVGDVAMPLRAASAGESGFTSSSIVTSAAHASGVAYLARWQPGASLRIGALDLASGQPLFPIVDLGQWKSVYQLAARPEGILVAGLKPTSRPHPELLSPADQWEVHFVVLEPSTGKVRWEVHVRFGNRLSAYLYPYGVLAANQIDIPALLDWTTGAPRWTITDNRSAPSFIDYAVPAITWAEPRPNAPLATATELDTSTPDDPRLAVHANVATGILDSRTGGWTNFRTALAPNDSATSVLFVGGSIYQAVGNRSGDVLYRFPADPPQPVDHGDSLWATTGSLVATTPCGSDRLCLTERPSSSPTGQRMVLLDTTSYRYRALPATVPTGGYAIGDRYVDPAGRVYDLTGALLGESSPLASAWWLTPGSLVGIDQTRLVSVSTVDGRRTVLGQLPAVPSQVVTANGCLVYADADGFHAVQYAKP
jgi:hypothetical protein